MAAKIEEAPRPEGYFADDYGPDEERIRLESSMGAVVQIPERNDSNSSEG